MLYIVSTPIGNMKDITYRAVEILGEVDFVLAEDSRRTGILLKHYGVSNKLIIYNDTNKERKTSGIIRDLLNDKNIALVTDSGTPGISDPGFYLVRECVKNNIKVLPIPGANAVISALVCSGLPTDRFTFYGFLPKKPGKFKELIDEANSRTETAIFYESPHRIIKTLKRLNDQIPDKQIVIGRELTKKFEEFIRGKVSDMYTQLKDKKLKGEIVVLLN
jgi:16S rRNA (cytidine1402-2'-O)-methyltransferase